MSSINNFIVSFLYSIFCPLILHVSILYLIFAFQQTKKLCHSMVSNKKIIANLALIKQQSEEI